MYRRLRAQFDRSIYNFTKLLVKDLLSLLVHINYAIFFLAGGKKGKKCEKLHIFSSPGRNPGRAIVLPPASALALAGASVLANCKSFYLLSFLCDGQGAIRRAILSL